MMEQGHRVIVDSYASTPLEGIERVRVEPQQPPGSDALAEGDVLVAVHRASINWVDLLMLSGQYQHMVEPPYTPGLEYSGVVAAVGCDVSSSKLSVGDRVMADAFSTGPRSTGAHQKHGGLASYAVAPAAALHPVPSELSLDQASCFFGSYETAYHVLVARGRLRQGERVLIHGASGATGLAAIQVAKRVGAEVIATGRSPTKLATVRDQGADHVVCLAREDDAPGVRSFRREVKELSGGQGVDVVFDPVGGEVSLESLRATRFGARFLIVGWAATPFVAKGKGQRGAPGANVLPTNLIMMKGLDVLGCPTAITTDRTPEIREERLRCLMQWLRAGDLSPVVGAVFPMSDVQEAMRAKWESRFVGHCVVQLR